MGAAVTKWTAEPHKQPTFMAHGSGSEFNIELLADSVPGKAFLPGVQTATFLLCPGQGTRDGFGGVGAASFY